MWQEMATCPRIWAEECVNSSSPQRQASFHASHLWPQKGVSTALGCLRRMSGLSYQPLCVHFLSTRLAPVGLYGLVMGCWLRKLHLWKATLYFSREPRTAEMSRRRGGRWYGGYSCLSKATNNAPGNTVPQMTKHMKTPSLIWDPFRERSTCARS